MLTTKKKKKMLMIIMVMIRKKKKTKKKKKPRALEVDVLHSRDAVGVTLHQTAAQAHLHLRT